MLLFVVHSQHCSDLRTDSLFKSLLNAAIPSGLRKNRQHIIKQGYLLLVLNLSKQIAIFLRLREKVSNFFWLVLKGNVAMNYSYFLVKANIFSLSCSLNYSSFLFVRTICVLSLSSLDDYENVLF